MRKTKPTGHWAFKGPSGELANGASKGHKAKGPKKLKLEWDEPEQFQVGVQGQEDGLQDLRNGKFI